MTYWKATHGLSCTWVFN